MGQYPRDGRNLQARFEQTIERIGEAALDDGSLPAAMDSIRDLLGADSALIFTPTTAPRDAGSLWLGNALDAESIARYQAHYHSIDSWAHGIAKQQIASDIVIVGDDVIATRDLRRSEWHTDFLSGYDILYLLTTGLLRPDQSFPPVYASFYRGLRAEPFEDLERRIYQRVIPYFRRALEVRGRLSGTSIQSKDAVAALDALAQPILLLDRTGRVLFINRSAERRSRGPDGIQVREGRPVVANHDDNELLDAAITRVVRGRHRAVEAVVLWRAPDRYPAVVLVAPLPRETGLRAAAMVIVGNNAESNRTRSREFARIHRLTATELRLVEALSIGKSIHEIAMERKVAANTVNKQVKQVMAKIGCHRQADVVRHFLCFPTRYDDEQSR